MEEVIDRERERGKDGRSELREKGELRRGGAWTHLILTGIILLLVLMRMHRLWLWIAAVEGAVR